MSWKVFLKDEKQEELSSIKKEFILENWVEVSKASEYKLLKYLDPFGDTIFNRLQIDDLIADLEKLQSVGSKNDIAEILALAKRCKLEAHTSLAFYGD